MSYVIGAYTDVGKKTENQDSYCVRTACVDEKEIVMAVLCDGMGGTDDGAAASEGTVEKLEEWFERKMPDILITESISEEEMRELLHAELEEVLKKRNQELISYGEREGKKSGTTVSCLLLMGNQGYIIHVGDSRIYCVNKGNISQLTMDHSFVAREVRNGRMAEKQARKDARRNQLTQCIGVSGEIYPQFISFTGSGKQNFLLCSDGLIHENTEKYLWKKLKSEKWSQESIEITLGKLAKRALKNGEKDNITAIMLAFDFER